MMRSDKIELSVCVSREVWRLIQEGKAKLQAGGVRAMDGTLIEQYRPIFTKSGSDTRMGVMPFAFHSAEMEPAADLFRAVKCLAETPLVQGKLKDLSSMLPFDLQSREQDAIWGAVQSIWRYANSPTVKKKLKKLAVTLKKTNVPWAQSALQMSNLTLTSVGFAVINARLDELSQQIARGFEDMKEEMRSIQLEDRLTSIEKLMDNLKSAAALLKRQGLTRTDILPVEEYLNEAKSQIKWLSEKFQKSSGTARVPLFTCIYNLSTVFGALIKEYGAQHYYLVGAFPQNYDGWIDALRFTIEETVAEDMKSCVWMQAPLASTDELDTTCAFSLNTMEMQIKELESLRENLPLMPKEAYFDFEGFLKSKFDNGEITLVDSAEVEDEQIEQLFEAQASGLAR